jgi:hypothetical protein
MATFSHACSGSLRWTDFRGQDAARNTFRIADLHVSLVKRKHSSPDARFGRAWTTNLPKPTARTHASRRWFLPSQNRNLHSLTPASEGPSQKIECAFSASPETIRREPREFDLRRSVGKWQDLAARALCNPVFPAGGSVYAAALL